MRTRILAIIGSFFLILLALAFGSVLHSSEYHPVSVSVGDDFETAIHQSEATHSVVPGAEKSFDWRFPDRRKTPYAIVQLHGFSASRREISPVGEILAQRLGANLFMTRLCGHGLLSHGMEDVTADCMLSDAEEAFAIGKKMGDKVILLGTSTGAPLAIYLARAHPDDVAALVLASPNFQLHSLTSLLLKGPIGNLISTYVIKTHHWNPHSDAEERYWTTSYPMTSVSELTNLLSWVDHFDFTQMKMPLAVFYTESDDTISVDRVKSRYAEYGGPKEIFEVKDAPHVLAGDIKNPQATLFVVDHAEDFLTRQLGLTVQK